MSVVRAIALAMVVTACSTAPAEDAAPAPIDAAPPALAARFDDCARCHVRETREHAATLHGQAFDDPLFQREWSTRRASFCVGCHAPLATDADDVRVHEGVGCASCHVENGSIVSRVASGRAPHASRALDDFGSAERCGPCHEFDFPTRHGPPRERLQRTLSEWHASGRQERCIECHMGEGSHALRGPRDEGLLARALDVDVTAERRGARAIVHATLVARAAHAVPTGDLNRTLVFRAWSGRASAEVELSRLFDRDEDGERIEIADQRVLPGTPRRLALELPRTRGPVHWSLTWHAIAPDAVAPSIDPAFRTREIASGVVRIPR